MKVFILIIFIVNLILYLSASFYGCSFDITKLGEKHRFCIAIIFLMLNLFLLACFTGIYLGKK